jgi:hypothetical protein
MMKTNLEHALRYAKWGLHVFPLHSITDDGVCSCSKGKECDSPGKHPRTRHGYKEATTDKEQINEWWTECPEANIGIATGRTSGIVVIDIDPRNGGNESFQELIEKYGALPDTYEVKTGGGGKHLYFKYIEGINYPSKLALGVDIKSDRGYVVAPPSNHVIGGKYKRDMSNGVKQPVGLPEEWINALGTKEAKQQDSEEEKILEGNRNTTLFNLARSLRLEGFVEDEILPSLLVMNKKKCVPPLDENEVRGIVKSVSQYKTSIQWTDPEPLVPMNLPEFPVDVFPTSIQQYLESVAEVIQVPVEMPACIALVSFALGLAGKIQVKVKNDFIEDCNLYFMISAETGTRKSAVFAEMMRPINEYQIAENKSRAMAIAQYKNKEEMLTKRINKLKDDYGKNKKGVKKEDILVEISNLEKEKMELDAVNELTLYTQDFSPEVLGVLLKEGNERLGILSSEGDLIDIWKGRYDSSGDISLYLKGYTGDAIKVHRLSRKHISLEKPLLTILVMAQPIVIEEALSNKQYSLRGLTGRFLYCIAKDLVGKRKYTSESISSTLRSTYYDRIKKLLSYDDTKVISLTKGAEELFAKMADENEKSMKGINSSIREWANRKPGFVLRIAGILHIMEWQESGAKAIPELISSDTIKKAIKVADYFTEHSRAAFEHMGHNQAVAEARVILRKIQESGKDELSHNQIYNLCRGQNRFREAKSIDRGLDVLCENGYLQKVSAQHIGPGRPRGSKYVLNPKA